MIFLSALERCLETENKFISLQPKIMQFILSKSSQFSRREYTYYTQMRYTYIIMSDDVVSITV